VFLLLSQAFSRQRASIRVDGRTRQPRTQTLTLVFAGTLDKDVATDAGTTDAAQIGHDRRTCSRLPDERVRMVDGADYCKVTR
jgi:hypothetical protein